MTRKLLIPLIILGFLLVGAAALFAYAQRPMVGAMEEQISLAGRVIVRGEDSVEVPALAQRIVADRRDYVLVDLRSAAAFRDEHIPGATNIALTDILQPERAREIARGRTLILYSEHTAEAAQAAILLRVAGVDAMALRGGFEGWLRYTGDPDSDPGDVRPVLSRAERQALACLFHGDYMPSAGIPIEAVRTAYTPPLAPVAPPAVEEPVVTAHAEVPEPADPLGLGQHLGVGILPPEPERHPDPLGLGLHLGVGLVSLPEPHPDPLGLGLALGLGVGLEDLQPEPEAPAAAAPAPAPAAPPPRRALRIGEGC
ncbi:rhodanese-like domain-containing protein [Thioalkalivibrio paradoxus]|uniref:Rhodanese domain-containing protein n=1 Tax=Thioalkalivibrio paradoxus ARh 1 TaxID=713585 RepID=W0DSC1_9GAMM|nr:rhodanese-like domain-containing protein [Thioalkalivibrio paradoxus]AHE99883.1 hypothetical protein THITH_03020 [Thioalkalivibrio paradoxus ARh 1]